jgi:hypothetical protein
MKKLVYLLFLSIIISCSSNNIIVKRLSDLIEIQSGDSVWVSWEFANAKYVRVGGYDTTFNPNDSILVKPLNSLRLDIIAYGENGAQLLQSVYVLVSPKETETLEKKTTVQRGPKFIEDIFSYKSTLPSDFFSGFYQGTINDINKLKIFRIKPLEKLDSCEISFALLDSYGNFCYDIKKYSSDVKIQLEQKCQTKSITSSYYPFPETIRIRDKLDIYFLIDYSAINELKSFKEYLLNAVKYLDVNDRVSLSFFGIETQNVVPLERADKFYWELKELQFPQKIELSSVYRSLCQILEEIEDPANAVLVLITKQMDNSSINFTLEDVIEKSLQKKVPINTLTFGNEVSPTHYRYISEKTGGNFYHFPWTTEAIDSALSEIVLSNKYYYSLKLPLDLHSGDCDDLELTLSVMFGKISFKSDYILPLKDKKFYTNFQAVSLFRLGDTIVSTSFLPTIENLARLLVNHRNLSVELIGTAGLNEAFYNPKELSLSRANSVRNILITKGASPSQIRTKGIGLSKPIYTEEEDDYTAMLNRRVEIRWLVPELLPYTIVVDTTSSEELAEKRVEYWEKQGFKAYYDRLFSNGNILYKVVLWGYSKYDEAEKDARKISRKYKKSTIIE